PTSVSGPADIFAALMRTYPVVSGRELEADFKIDFVTEKKGVFRKQPWGEKAPREITKNDRYDLIIIPAMFSNKIEEVVQKEQKIIEWLKRQHKANTELASICVGSF